MELSSLVIALLIFLLSSHLERSAILACVFSFPRLVFSSYFPFTYCTFFPYFFPSVLLYLSPLYFTKNLYYSGPLSSVIFHSFLAPRMITQIANKATGLKAWIFILFSLSPFFSCSSFSSSSNICLIYAILSYVFSFQPPFLLLPVFPFPLFLLFYSSLPCSHFTPWSALFFFPLASSRRCTSPVLKEIHFS